MPNPKQRIIVDGVDFESIVQFPRLLRSVTAAMQPPRLIIGLLMVTALITAGRVWDGVAGATVSPNGVLAGRWSPLDQTRVDATLRSVVALTGATTADGALPSADEARQLLDARVGELDPVAAKRLRRQLDTEGPRGVFEASAAEVAGAVTGIVRGVVSLRPAEVGASLVDLFARLPVALWRSHCWFLFGFGAFTIVVLALGGGAISRMAACQWAMQERLRVRDALDFALGRCINLVMAPSLVLLLLGVLAGVAVLLGVLMRVPVLDVVGALLYPVALLLAAGIAFLLVGYIPGVSLMVPAVACEACDAADAGQRAYAYVFSRPLHRAGYALVNVIGFAVGYVIVAFFVAVTLNGAAASFGAWSGGHAALTAAGGAGVFDLVPGRAALATSAEGATAAIIGLFRTVVVCLVPAYVLSYAFTSSTLTYLLIRRASDGQDIEEIWRPGLVPGTMAPIRPGD